jgi:hypothetical protein
MKQAAVMKAGKLKIIGMNLDYGITFVPHHEIARRKVA